MPSIDFDLRQLEIFCKVVDLGSFSKAAEAVFLAQASVSERIATLENMIGTKLLDRLGRQVVPTKAGELLYRHAILLLDMKKTARQDMEDFLGKRQGEIHMGASTIPGEYILPRVIGRFNEKYPSISVVLSVADTGDIESGVVGGELELGVIGSRSSHRSLLSHEWWKDDLVLAVSAQHRWAKKRQIALKALYKEPMILREKGSGTLKIFEASLQSTGAKGLGDLQVVARLGSSTAIKEGVKAGLGVSILSSKAMETELKAGILKALKVRGLPLSRSFYLIRDKRRTASPLCQTMYDFLRSISNDNDFLSQAH